MWQAGCKGNAVAASDGSNPVFGRWLARLSFSFLIVAGALAWQGYRTLSAGTAIWPAAVELFASAAAISLSVAGFRERHRRQDPG